MKAGDYYIFKDEDNITLCFITEINKIEDTIILADISTSGYLTSTEWRLAFNETYVLEKTDIQTDNELKAKYPEYFL
jgi:hypothetical protein